MGRLEEKVAIITGAGSGLGRAAAGLFAREGARVVIAERSAELGQMVQEEIVREDGKALFVQTDVTQHDQVKRMVQATLGKFGRLDCAVNNAGIVGPRFTPVADVTEAEWDKVMSVNLRGAWLCMKHEIPAMLANGGGAIVNVASIYGLKPGDIGHAPYATSKHALVGLTKSAASDYGQMNLRINAVAPGFTHSEMVDVNRPGAAPIYQKLSERHSGMKRLGEAVEVANAIAWLCSGEASFVNGMVMPIDGGGAGRLW